MVVVPAGALRWPVRLGRVMMVVVRGADMR